MEQFIVSARKYRPATFASVVGQQHITSTLRNAIERGQLAHAYLFCGPRGVGKTTCARIFAKTINCQDIHDGEACDRCESCRSVADGTSMYIHELDAASNNSVDNIRELIEKVRVIPQGSKYSVFIIDEVHMLSTQAFNAFLKTLEEPPQHAIFILATTEKHKIIPTILSRCQIFDFNRIRVEDVVGYLKYISEKEGVTYDEESLNLIAQKADGGMRDALSMFDKSVSFCGNNLNYRDVAASLNILDYDTYFRFVSVLNDCDYVSALLEFDRILSAGFSAQTFLAGLDKHMRDLLVSKGPAITLVEYTESLLERFKSQAAECTEGFLFGAIDLLTEAEDKIRFSSNGRLLAELTIMKISQLGQKKNSPLTPRPQTQYPLPQITAPQPQATPARQATSPVQQSNPAPAPAPKQAPAPQPQPQQQQQPQATAVAAQEQGTSTAAEASRSVETSIRQSSFVTEKTGSLTKLMKQVHDKSTSNSENGHDIVVDPDTEEKFNKCREAIVEAIQTSHPRMAAALNSIAIEGSTVRFIVPTQALNDEIMKERDSLTKQIVDTAGINGALRIAVEIREVEVHMRPTRLEDKLQHIKNNSREFDSFVKALDLEIE